MTESSSGYTQCPSCLTLYRVPASYLAVAEGRVRCGLCGEDFDATERHATSLPDDLPLSANWLSSASSDAASSGSAGAATPPKGFITPEPVSAAASDDEPAPPTDDFFGFDDLAAEYHEPLRHEADATRSVKHRAQDAMEQAPFVGEPAVAPSGEARGAAEAPSDPDAEITAERPADRDDWHLTTALEVESESRGGSGHGGRRIGLVAALLALALLAAGQLAWLNREALAAHPLLRPAVAAICDVAGCRLAPQRHPESVRIVERALVPHPSVDGALLLTAVIRNDAAESQPWPQLGLSLTAVDGEVLARHWFAPEDYLADPVLASATMPAGEAVPVRVAFRDPAGGAEGFRIDFR